MYSDSKITDKWSLPNSLLSTFLGTVFVFSVLLGMGNILYSELLAGSILFVVGGISALGIYRLWK